MRFFGAEIEGSGIGKFQPWLDSPVKPDQLNTGLHHPMGGIRMHADPDISERWTPTAKSMAFPTSMLREVPSSPPVWATPTPP